MSEVVPGANREHYLQVDEVVNVARYLIRLDDNVKLGPGKGVCDTYVGVPHLGWL